MRILIVGAGIGGLTLAGLLRRHGQNATVIERAPDFTNTGYMLGIYPLGGRVLHALGLHEQYVAESQVTRTYSLWNSRGRHVKDYSFEDFAAEYGPYQMLSRGKLIELLLLSLGETEARTGTTVESLTQRNAEVQVRFRGGEEENFDLVVAADGMFSSTRAMVFGETPLRRTGWGGWIWWSDAEIEERDTVSEYWSTGSFLGVYPTLDRAGVFLGGPNANLQDADEQTMMSFAEEHFGHAEGVAPAVISSPKPERFYWELLDVRSPEWTKGRVVLLGDAAAGFLPTAGIGASVAMESAAALADELSRSDAKYVPLALTKFVKRRKRRVESAQSNSRSLARLMLTSSRATTIARDVLMRFYTMEQALKPIRKIMDEPL